MSARVNAAPSHAVTRRQPICPPILGRGCFWKSRQWGSTCPPCGPKPASGSVLLTFPQFFFLLEIRSPSRPDGQRGTHGPCRWRGVDGVLGGFLHPSLSHRNTGAAAGDQHFHPLNPAEHWYATSHMVASVVRIYARLRTNCTTSHLRRSFFFLLLYRIREGISSTPMTLSSEE